jgi:hypothetical protein
VPHDSQPHKCNSHANFSFFPETVPEENRIKNVLELDMTGAIKVKQAAQRTVGQFACLYHEGHEVTRRKTPIHKALRDTSCPSWLTLFLAEQNIRSPHYRRYWPENEKAARDSSPSSKITD